MHKDAEEREMIWICLLRRTGSREGRGRKAWQRTEGEGVTDVWSRLTRSTATRLETRARDRIEVAASAHNASLAASVLSSLSLGSQLWPGWCLPSQSQQTKSTASYMPTSKTQASSCVSMCYVFDVNHHHAQAFNTVPSCSEPRLNSPTLQATANTYLVENSWSFSAKHYSTLKSKRTGEAAACLRTAKVHSLCSSATSVRQNHTLLGRMRLINPVAQWMLMHQLLSLMQTARPA